MSQPTFPFNPDWVIHPGTTLREWREDNHLPASAAAIVCGRMPLAMYEGIEAGAEPITEVVASALEHGTSIPARLWLNLERNFRSGLAAGKVWTMPAMWPRRRESGQRVTTRGGVARER